MTQPKTNSKIDLAAHSRFKNPYDNLLYGILLQAVSDNDIDYLKHGDGAIIWSYLTTCTPIESARKRITNSTGKPDTITHKGDLNNDSITSNRRYKSPQ